MPGNFGLNLPLQMPLPPQQQQQQQQQPTPQQQQQQEDAIKQRAAQANAAASRRQSQNPSAQTFLGTQDDTLSRHSHSHDPSHPGHHLSLNRHQHRHTFSPYGYPSSSADQSLANSPASSPDAGHLDDEQARQVQTHSGSASPFPPVPSVGAGIVPGIGMASQPGHGQAQAIGQLQQQLAFQLTPSTSPVIPPLQGLTLMSAQGSRAPSAAPSRATSPVHLPPLRLPGAEGGNSGEGSRAQSPNHDALQQHPLDSHHRSHSHHQRSHPYSRPGSPANASHHLVQRPPLSRGSTNSGNGSFPTTPVAGPVVSEERSLPPLSALNSAPSSVGSTSGAYFPSGSRPNSRPTSPNSGLHSAYGSSDSLASLGSGNGISHPQNSGQSYSRRVGFGMTPIVKESYSNEENLGGHGGGGGGEDSMEQ